MPRAMALPLTVLLIATATVPPPFIFVDASSAAGQETLVGVLGTDFVMLGADSSSSSSISLTSSNLDKILVLNDPFPSGRRGGWERSIQEGSYSSSFDPRVDEEDPRVDGEDDRTDEEGLELISEGVGSKEEELEQRYRRSLEQQTIVAAAAGDSADADRLLGILSAHSMVREFEAGVGCDVECVFDGRKKAASSVEEGMGEGVSAQQQRRNRPGFGITSPAGLDAESIAYLARGEIASSLRSGSGQLRVCLLVAGMVKGEGRRRRGDKSSGPREYDARLANELDEASERADVGSADEDASMSARIQLQVEAATTDFKKSHIGRVSEDKALTVTSDDNDSASSPAFVKRKPDNNSFLEPRLIWLDEYGSLQKLEYGAHGFGANFALSILDRNYRPDLTREEAANLIRDCFEQLRTRYVINSPQPPCIKCVDADGCRLVGR